MIRTICLLALTAPVAAWAGPKHDAVMDVLNAFEEPVREADLAALGEGVDAELMEIAVDAKVPASRRGRAISGLQFYRTEPVRAFLEQQLASGTPVILRRKAAASLAVWGSPAVPALVPALSDSDLQLRLVAAQALGRIGDESARKALQERLASESEPLVKDAITVALGVPR